jgi:plastocyanin
MKTFKTITVSIMAFAIVVTTFTSTTGLLFVQQAQAQYVPSQSLPTTIMTVSLDDDDRFDDDDINTISPPPTTTTTIPGTTQTNNTGEPQQTTTTTPLAADRVNASSGNKTFYLFNDEVDDDFDENGGVQGQQLFGDDDIDIYSLQTMVVNSGDTVTVHFFNLDDDDDDERHSFTIGEPYNIDADLAGGESTDVTFIADTEGIFQYYCKYEQPQMIGQLVVLPQSQ